VSPGLVQDPSDLARRGPGHRPGDSKVPLVQKPPESLVVDRLAGGFPQVRMDPPVSVARLSQSHTSFEPDNVSR